MGWPALGALLFVVISAWIAFEFEFNRRFENVLWRLNPSELKRRRGYAVPVAREGLTYKRVVKWRLAYVAASVLMVLAPAVIFGWWDLGILALQQLIPQFLAPPFAVLVAGSDGSLFFVLVVTLIVFLHVPAALLNRNRDSLLDGIADDEWNTIERVASRLFQLQEWMLSIMICRLLRVPVSRSGEQNKKAIGHTREAVKTRFANRMVQRVDREALEKEFARLRRGQVRAQLGVGIRGLRGDEIVEGADENAMTPLQKIMEIIEERGLPYAEAALGWDPESSVRQEDRTKVNLGVSVKVASTEFEATLRNVGHPSNKERVVSAALLVNAMDSDAAEALQDAALLEIQKVGDRSERNTLRCTVESQRVVERHPTGRRECRIGVRVHDSDGEAFARLIDLPSAAGSTTPAAAY